MPKIVDKQTQQEYDSQQEMYFSWWLQELKDNGYIKRWNKSSIKFSLSLPIKVYDVEQCKNYSLLQGHVYTADFDIIFEDKARGIFFNHIGNVKPKNLIIKNTGNSNLCVIEIKATGRGVTKLRSHITFPINQKWVYHRYNVYVNEIEITNLFYYTFTPFRYLYTDTGRQKRKIHFPVFTLEEYLEQFKDEK